MNGWRGAPRRSLFCGLLIAAAGIIGLEESSRTVNPTKILASSLTSKLIVYSPSTEGNGFEAFFDG